VATDEVIEQRLGEDPEDEQVKERLEREHSELLEELRALIPGAEVL
jgi:DNA-directed RNA polymerase specialized sigma subunit